MRQPVHGCCPPRFALFLICGGRRAAGAAVHTAHAETPGCTALRDRTPRAAYPLQACASPQQPLEKVPVRQPTPEPCKRQQRRSRMLLRACRLERTSRPALWRCTTGLWGYSGVVPRPAWRAWIAFAPVEIASTGPGATQQQVRLVQVPIPHARHDAPSVATARRARPERRAPEIRPAACPLEAPRDRAAIHRQPATGPARQGRYATAAATQAGCGAHPALRLAPFFIAAHARPVRPGGRFDA